MFRFFTQTSDLSFSHPYIQYIVNKVEYLQTPNIYLHGMGRQIVKTFRM